MNSDERFIQIAIEEARKASWPFGAERAFYMILPGTCFGISKSAFLEESAVKSL